MKNSSISIFVDGQHVSTQKVRSIYARYEYISDFEIKNIDMN